MVTKVNDTVFDSVTPPISTGVFTNLEVNSSPVSATDVVNLAYFTGNAITSSGGIVIGNILQFKDVGLNQIMDLNVGDGDPSVGPDIAFIGDGYMNAGDDMYIGFDADDTGSTLKFVRGGTTVPASEIVGEFGDGWLRITRPDQPGAPDDSVYLLLDQQPSDTPAPGGARGPAVIFHNPDNTAQGNTYDYAKIHARDDKIFSFEADTALGTGAEVSLMSIMQDAGVYFDFHAHLLKNALDPVDAQDLATKAYVDATGSGSTIVAFSAGPLGYIQWGNGFTIQWGSLPNAGLATVVTFPAVFTGIFTVLAQSEAGINTSLSGPPTTAGFTGWAYNSAGTPQVIGTFYWVAFGII